ncbi:hypothetical protein [Helicobacter sp. T3_23-1059]
MNTQKQKVATTKTQQQNEILDLCFENIWFAKSNFSLIDYKVSKTTTTSAIESKSASKSQDLRGTSPQLRSSDLARKREWAQLRKQNLAEDFASCPPSLAEGARGWVSLEVSKSPASLKSQNLQSKEKTDSSKADIAKEKSNNANFASAKSTHPQTPSAREGAFRSVATLSNEGASFWASSAREGVFKAKIQTTNPKKLALSLATSALLAGVALLDTSAANCIQRSAEGQSYLDCFGSMPPQDLSTAINNKNMLINLGRGEANPLNVGAGSVTATISNNLVFRSVNAPNTDFSITGNSGAGLLLPYTLGNHTANASTLRSLTVSGTINNQSYGSDEVYGNGVKIAFDIHAGTQIGRREADGTIIGGITLKDGANITNAAMAIYGGYAGGTRSTFVSQIAASGTNASTIQTLNLGYYKFAGDYADLFGNYLIGTGGTINVTTLNVYQSTITLDSVASTWNGHNLGAIRHSHK